MMIIKDGNSALMYAVAENQIQAAKLLISRGCNPNMANVNYSLIDSKLNLYNMKNLK